MDEERELYDGNATDTERKAISACYHVAIFFFCVLMLILFFIFLSGY